jgi:hypothetical protein
MRQLVIWTGWGALENQKTHTLDCSCCLCCCLYDCSSCGCCRVGLIARVFGRVYFSILRAPWPAVTRVSVLFESRVFVVGVLGCVCRVLHSLRLCSCKSAACVRMVV